MRNNQLRILMIADPLENLKPASDTSVALAEAALAMGHRVSWCEPADVIMHGIRVQVARSFEVLEMTAAKQTLAPASALTPLDEFTHAFVRKDPPFDDNYRDLCWLLAAQCHTKIVNSAESLLTFHEKAVQWRAQTEGYLEPANLIPTCVSAHARDLIQFRNGPLASDATVVLKPWLGHGGEDIIHVKSKADFDGFLSAHSDASGHMTQKWMLQPFLPEVHTAGDRRVIIAAGSVLTDFVRFPAEGKIEANLARGGTARLVPMTSAQTQLMQRLADFLLKNQILFAGVDLIGDKVSEVNITSPTGVRTAESLYAGRNFGKELFAALTTFLLCFFLSGCMSGPGAGSVLVSADDPLVALKKQWSESCFLPETGQFASFLRSENAPELVFEGAWQNHFQKFEGRLQNPAAETLLTINLGQNSEVFSDLKFVSDAAQKKNLMNLPTS